jgi:polyphosphate kinase
MLPYLLSGPANSIDEGTGGVYWYFDRDLSWLRFNERVLMEAEKTAVPLLERLSFLAIYSSNLDEFYRVRMPAIAALHKLYKKDKMSTDEQEEYKDTAKQAVDIIAKQLERYGQTLRGLIGELRGHGVHIAYNEPIPEAIRPQVSDYFFTQVLAHLKPIDAEEAADFLPENNQLYMAIAAGEDSDTEALKIIKLPTAELPRFYSIEAEGTQYVVFLDDILRHWAMSKGGYDTPECYTFKVTRDAELPLDDIYEADMAEKIEKQISKRDFGLATRLLHEPDMPEPMIAALVDLLGLTKALVIGGGRYHALKDLSSLPVNKSELKYESWPARKLQIPEGESLLDRIMQRDILLHPPFDSYDTVLRFFNEAAFHRDVVHIYLTMYRVASDSKIINALLSAAHNGKKVTVLVELKARFDEANNIKWAKQLKKAGVEVLYTRESLKVHAKVALVKFKGESSPRKYVGLLATGNLNESTARFYTDHILLTADEELLAEEEKLFAFFSGNEQLKRDAFQQLLVAQFNLQQGFIDMIDREIANKRLGLPAGISIKMNNLEERVLINKLYEASHAGVPVRLIVRGICCLVPGLPGQSEHIQVKRIVDRYLEHGRIFIFEAAGSAKVYMGSADWMNRNIYRRVEVCFPVKDEALNAQMRELFELQWQDDAAAVWVTENDMNAPVSESRGTHRSQEDIYRLVANS